MYGKCGSVAAARELSDKIPKKGITLWNAMIAGYAQNGLAEEALGLFNTMQQWNVTPNLVSVVSVLPAYADLADLQQGKGIHDYVVRNGFDSILPKHGKSDGCSCHALQTDDANRYAYLLQASVDGRNIRQGKMLHTHFIITGTLKENSFYGFKLAILYALCGSMEDAREVFDKMSQRRILLWNVMIRGYACNGQCEEALRLYLQMQEVGVEPNHYTFPFVLEACASLSALQQGNEIHSDVVRLRLQSDIYVGTALIDMHGKWGSVAVARELFDKIPEKGITSWNAMIAGYAQNGLAEEALGLFNTMQQPNVTPNLVIVVSVLPAYADLADLQQGKGIHEYVVRNGFDSDVSVWNSLVAMYTKCGSTETAYNIFDKMRKRTVVSWNVMITGYT